jgi:ketosteroid isomerase-like protein
MELMKGLHDAFNAKDLDTLDKLMADDFVFVRHQSGTEVKHKIIGHQFIQSVQIFCIKSVM